MAYNIPTYYYPTAERNKEPILSVLHQYITTSGTFLEIASGTGQHVSFFASNFPNVMFYPSEWNQPDLMCSIISYSQNLINVKEPLNIDVRTDYKTWGQGIFHENQLDYMYNANLTHNSKFDCTIGLFRNAGKLLKPGGILFLYGPFAINGNLFPESNVQFHNSLKDQNSDWGIRDVRDLKKLATKNRLLFVEMVDMPESNKTLIWKKSNQ